MACLAGPDNSSLLIDL